MKHRHLEADMSVLARAATVLLIGVSSLGAQTFPTRGWSTTTPQAVGIRKEVLDSIDQEIASGRYGLVDRMLVIRHQQVAYDRSYHQDYDKAYADSVNVAGPLNAHDVTGPYNYYNPWWHPYYRRGDLHTLQSVTKTITSVVFGVAVTRGDFTGLERPVLSFFPAGSVANVDERKSRMTVRHLMTMTSGIDWNENLPYADPKNTATALEASSDWVKFVMDRPMSDEPGKRYNYNSGATEILAQVFRKATGYDIEEYAAKNLFAPLGIDHWHWKRIPTGLIDTEGGLYLEARDLAKIWYLFLHDGKWDDKQIVSSDWVKQSTTPFIKTSAAANAPSYGLAWWLFPTGADASRFYWAGSGFGGQFPIASVAHDLVVVFNAWNILPGRANMPARRLVDRIVAGISESPKR
jgi:CubicO group peptidase (beta-lactamase class C family)